MGKTPLLFTNPIKEQLSKRKPFKTVRFFLEKFFYNSSATIPPRKRPSPEK